MTTFEVTEKENWIVVMALSVLDSTLDAFGGDDSLRKIADHLRESLRTRGVKRDDIKDLAVKFGVPEKAAYSAGHGLQ
jgi:hypothetical protein